MIIQIIAIALIFGLIVTVHEWGHFLSARSIGIAVQEFSVGVGPAIWKKQGKNTLFSLRCLPLGGFCLFDGEIEGVDHRGRPLSILKRKALAKIYVSLAGPLLNFFLGALLFTLLFSLIGVTTGFEAVVGLVSAGSAAEEAGILPGDRVLSIDGETVETWADLSRITAEKAEGEPMVFVIARGADTLRLTAASRYNAEEKRAYVGVSVDAAKAIVEKMPPLTSVALGLRQTATLIGALFDAIVQMVTGKISVSENISGPVALVRVIGETVSSGFSDTLFLTAFLSLNLGMMNLLPVPALDGGKILVYLVEILRRKPLSLKVEGWINAAGLILVLSLMLLLTFKDVFQLLHSP